MTKLEFIDIICQNVTHNGKLPMTVDPSNIERIMEYNAIPYFYRNYYHALRTTHYYVDLISMKRNLGTDTKIIQLPQEIESIKWIYQVGYHDMMEIGNMISQAGLFRTSVPFVSHMSIADYGTSLAVAQNVSSALASFSKPTLDFNFDPNTKFFEILTSLNKNLVLKVYARIPEEYLYEDPYFMKYVSGVAMQDYVIEMNLLDTTLSGNTKLNMEKIFDRGTAYIEEVKERITELNKTGYFLNKTN